MIKLAIEAIVFGFITKAEWPPSSPDTYPLYYCFLAVTENESSTQHHNIEVLNAKYGIKFPWKLCAAINIFPKRFQYVIFWGYLAD